MYLLKNYKIGITYCFVSNIRNRRSISAFGIYTKYKKIKEILEKAFLSKQASYRLAKT